MTDESWHWSRDAARMGCAIVLLVGLSVAGVITLAVWWWGRAR